MSDTLNVALEIEKLDELRTRKVITDEEFADRKAKLLTPAKPGKIAKQKRPGAFLAVSVVGVSLLVGAAYGGNGAVILGTMFGLFIYLLPAFIAYQRAHTNRHAILVINLFLGWSVIGWLGALIWSCTSAKSQPVNLIVGFAVAASLLGGMLSPDVQAAEELYPDITREKILAHLDLRDQAGLCVSKKIANPYLAEPEGRRLYSAIYDAAVAAGIDYPAVGKDPQRWIQSGQYEKFSDYMEYISNPIGPKDSLPGDALYRMTEHEWLAEKQKRLQIAKEWCASIERKLRAMYDVLDAPR